MITEQSIVSNDLAILILQSQLESCILLWYFSQIVVIITSSSDIQFIPRDITAIYIKDGCCNNYTEPIVINDYQNLVTLSIGNQALNLVPRVIVKNCPKIRTIKIGDNALRNADIIAIHNHQSLYEISIGNDSCQRATKLILDGICHYSHDEWKIFH